ncbi:hypothetical protein [Streptomyces sp. NPDC048191]|uniref:hypothetical protein n=1 Tax=Streptomyces sp. NPDC048191 TaxID=3155484 RepID=UPI0033C23AD0
MQVQVVVVARRARDAVVAGRQLEAVVGRDAGRLYRGVLDGLAGRVEPGGVHARLCN